jgi:transcriptional regulator with GAF, ATPase, and Fis domain
VLDGISLGNAISVPEVPPMIVATDYTADLERLTALASDPNALEEVLSRGLASLARIVPYDLAAVYELDGEDLFVRAAVGALASDRVRRNRLSLARFPALRRALAARRPMPLDEHDHSREGDPYDGVLDLPPGHSCMLVPLCAGDRDLGIITLDRMVCGGYEPAAVELAGLYGHILAMAMTIAAQAALLERYQRRLKEENRLLREELGPARRAVQMVRASGSPAMREVARLAEQVARSDAPVLITGETGAGKEVLARAIHAWSPRAEEPFVTLNCAAIPDNLVESELFGYVRGAFTGAAGDRPGRFLTADRGTLFLDEIGDMPQGAQAKLLRVLQEGSFEPVGTDRTVHVDVRVIAATHVDLEAAAAERRFRDDLYFRIAVFPLRVPALRDRPEDIPGLAQTLLDDIAERRGRGPWTLSPAAIAALDRHPWPGNVRQLVNVLERAVILKPHGELGAEHVEMPGVAIAPAPLLPAQTPVIDEPLVVPFEANERRYLERVLERTRGKIYGVGGAAALLGMPPTTLQSKLRKLGIR